MRQRSSAVLALALTLPAAVATGAAAPPQTPPAQGFAESIEVDVVSVEVFVNDRAGRPVAGLARGDFELRVDGKPVPITNFYAGAGAAETGGPPASGAPADASGAPPASSAPAAAAVPEDQRLYLIVFVDNVSLTAEARARSLDSLSQFFRTGLRPADRVLLASYDGQALKVRRPPAGDPAAIVAAFREVASVTARGSHAAAEEAQALADLGNAARPAEAEAAQQRLEMLDQQIRGDTRGLMAVLRDLAGLVAGLPGRKALLYLAGDLRIETGDPRVKDLAARANAGQVTLYGLSALVDPPGAGDPDGQLTRRLFARRDGLSKTLYEMSGPTGGLSAVDLLNPAAILARIRSDLGSYYSLGFVPDSPHDGKAHRLDVRVTGRKGIEVRYPASYTARSRDERLAERALAALALQVADNPLGLHLAIAGEKPARGGRRTVSVLVELPLAKLTLVPGQGVHEGKVVLLATARDAAGKRLPLRRITLPIRIPDGRLPAALSQAAAYRLDLELPPGAATIAVAMRDELGTGEAVATADYVVGAPAPAPGTAPGTAPLSSGGLSGTLMQTIDIESARLGFRSRHVPYPPR